MSRRSSLASLLLERLGEEQEEEEGKKAMPSMSMPFRVLGDEELPAWLGLPWSPKSWPPSSSSQVFVGSVRSSLHYDVQYVHICATKDPPVAIYFFFSSDRSSYSDGGLLYIMSAQPLFEILSISDSFNDCCCCSMMFYDIP